VRILHLAKYYWPRSGGRERVVQGLAEGAAQLGHEAEVYAVETRWDWSKKRRHKHNVTRAFSFGVVGSQELAPGYLTAAWKSADLIHVHHPHSLADLACLLRLRRTPLVVTQHQDARPGPLAPRLARRTLRRAGAIVVPSSSHVALCRELVGFESKVEVIPFGIDERRWMEVPPPPGGKPARAIFIGRLVRWKGVDILLRALQQTEDVELDIVGHGLEAPRLKTLAKALAITDRVRFFGEFPDEDLPFRMAAADFLVLPSVSVNEMFGLVALEAMAAGRPVITTDLPSGVRDVNIVGETGFVVPLRDVNALASAIQTLAADPALARKMGEAGRRRVEEQFTREVMARRHVELYERLVAGR
jgi:rhamnosyl/mannosyltransferase